jgi:phosphoglucosamine mutase
VGRIFGTDGVRGVANLELTPELAFRVGRAAAAVIAHGHPPDRPIVIGRDTRLSGTMLEAAVVAGITSAGRDTLSIGIVPTPGVALVTRTIEAAAGVMISASHNPIEDNGLKFFGPDGFKLSDEDEAEIEARLEATDLPRPTHAGVGIARSATGLVEKYVTALREAGGNLAALTIVVDAAYGAAYEVGPRILAELGAHVIAMHAENDGARINVSCGATDLTALCARVRDVAAAEPAAHVVGVAFDGDADRALFVDETGEAQSGDHIMMILAQHAQEAGTLRGDGVVGTVMSNIGLERALGESGLRLLRAPVGDRYVLERMRADGYSLGGEQSGHIIDLNHNTTGDGPMTAVILFSIVAREQTTLRALGARLRVAPQILVNVRTARKDCFVTDERVRAAIAAAEESLGASGRVLVRSSGTEPLVRVMMEGDDGAEIGRLANQVAQAIREAVR